MPEPVCTGTCSGDCESVKHAPACQNSSSAETLLENSYRKDGVENFEKNNETD